jgi:predicted GIY-YIG superfamily endonuclease
MQNSLWWVYVLVSQSGRTYVGSSTDVNRRLDQHNGILRGGAKCTRAWRPWTLAKIYGPYDGRSSAFKAEIALKRTKRGKGRLEWKVEDSIHCKIYNVNET